MANDMIPVRVPDDTSPYEIDSYLAEKHIKNDNFVFLGRESKGKLLFMFDDKQSAMMFKLRFGG